MHTLLIDDSALAKLRISESQTCLGRFQVSAA
jgi:hypothetical protein